MIIRNFLALLVLFFAVNAHAEEAIVTVPQSEGEIKLSFAPLVKKVAPAVVNIYTRRNLAKAYRAPFMDDPFFGQLFNHEFFGGIRKQLESALGSGVIVSEDGLIVTNAHVVQHAEEITIAMSDGTEYDARVVLADEASDLALLRVNQSGVSLPFVKLKPSASLEVGDLVLAIGNPFGVGQTVTSGIVSAQGRSTLDINDYNFFIQTDAAINPGNSGGALVSMDGGVVGINTAIYSRSGGSLGIGFAIPSEMVASVIAAELSGQKGIKGILRPWFGVESQDVTKEIAEAFGLDQAGGALISELHSASPLKEAGAEVGDIITSVNKSAIKSAAELKFRMATVLIGQSAKVEMIRKGKPLTVTLTAVAPPNIPPRNETILRGQHPLNGFVVSNLNPAVSVELGLKGEEKGVVIIQTPQNFGFFRILEVGDMLLDVNGRKIEKPEDVEPALKSGNPRAASLTIRRNGRTTRLMINR